VAGRVAPARAGLRNASVAWQSEAKATAQRRRVRSPRIVARRQRPEMLVPRGFLPLVVH
jgi:hypothetical protein